ncbi:MAG: hypothetical protein UX45_C0007G0030 [Candidatus Uhrbacteria bacterium GW2011_GWF2_46_218]|uniref:Uncharacterized protein n=1 Tax=Candidatus Uhrbacteria bacterium GW2011_GWF2_46_218 TaxID=1619001 RepID=A0A0G1RUR4_9BACT|nr:MAG: hypothetical protein UX45_C0007G0030 [Candidatus Uhrbacteria bacterium GW2011_GWF2_46_218]
MSPIALSASELKKRIEHKAFAYGVSSVVSTLLGEYVIELLRATSHPPLTPSYERLTSNQ